MGQPFEDDTLLVHPLSDEKADDLAPSLVHSLAHAWIHSNRPWIDEGLAQFLSVLWIERKEGRSAALAQMEAAERGLALIEPAAPAPDADAALSAPSGSSSSSSSSAESPPHDQAPEPPVISANGTDPGQSLLAATSEVYYRTKAAAVWWMLRSILGDQALQQALRAYRLNPALDRDPMGMEKTLEKFSHKDLRWFFDDWVYRDRGLPDLTILSVTPSQLDSHSGLPDGWLVAVHVRNDGYATADVPVTVSSSTARETVRLRTPGRSDASTRIVFPGTPDVVEVNDGGVPETRASVHTRQLILPAH